MDGVVVVATINFPAIKYEQGGRVMYTAVMEPRALVKLVEEPRIWNPVKRGTDLGTNRPLSEIHVKGIVEYMERTLPADDGEYVMDSVTLYGNDQDLIFTSAEGQVGPIQQGVLSVSFDARFDIGNGQHRITAHERIAASHPEEDDPVAVAQRRVGQPVVIVADRNPLRRAQDFVTLQRNVKTLPGSMAESMDTSQPLNAYLVDLCKAEDAPKILGGKERGDRLIFATDAISKYGKQLLTYRAYRYISGTAMIGVDQRTTAGWKKAVNNAFESDPRWKNELAEMWTAWGDLPGIKEVLAGELSPEDLRATSLVLGGAVTYACAYAIHLLKTNDGISLGEGVKRLAAINFNRPNRVPTETKPLTKNETIFAGNIIDPATGKVASGRPAWETAGQELYERIRKA
ncbi:MAG: hypothetical protein ORN51_07045 [Akkermansiaceae bacterium]|nr:hypothetical protein [Akkermansiaceae bacterium]